MNTAAGSQKLTIAVAMTCFNRRDLTLRCLESLLSQQHTRLVVYLVDDGCTDGTGEAVRSAYPSVRVLKGSGRLFWGGGMHMALSETIRHPFDFVLWLNDDVVLKSDALETLIAAHARATHTNCSPSHIIVGAMEDPDTGAITYSGYTRRSRWHPAQLRRANPVAGALTPCDTLNGNCVLVPREVIERIGIIDPAFPHQLGDIDYGFRAGRANIPVWIAPDTAGYCGRNHTMAPWTRAGLGWRQKLAALFSPLGLPPIPWLRFHARYAGPLAPVLLGASYIKALAGRRLS